MSRPEAESSAVTQAKSALPYVAAVGGAVLVAIVNAAIVAVFLIATIGNGWGEPYPGPDPWWVGVALPTAVASPLAAALGAAFLTFRLAARPRESSYVVRSAQDAIIVIGAALFGLTVALASVALDLSVDSRSCVAATQYVLGLMIGGGVGVVTVLVSRRWA